MIRGRLIAGDSISIACTPLVAEAGNAVRARAAAEAIGRHFGNST